MKLRTQSIFKHGAGPVVMWDCFCFLSPEALGTLLVRNIASCSQRSIKRLKLKYDFLCQEAKTGLWLDPPTAQWSKTYIQIYTKMVQWPLNQALHMTIPVPVMIFIENLAGAEGGGTISAEPGPWRIWKLFVLISDLRFLVQ